MGYLMFVDLKSGKTTLGKLLLIIIVFIFIELLYISGLGSMYSVLRYFGTRVSILQYLSVLCTRTFKKYLYSYLYSSTFKNENTFNEYL